VYLGLYTAVPNLADVSTVISRRRKGETMGWKEVVAIRMLDAMLHSSTACGGGSGLVQRRHIMWSLVPLERVRGSASSRKGTRVRARGSTPSPEEK
jgi:hypothetical protein